MSAIFRVHAPLYRARGLYSRPVQPGTKACKLVGWQRPDPEIPAAELDRWLIDYGDHGIGLRMGSPLPDGTWLGAIDVDRDDYLPLARVLLANPICGRIGEKGAVFFVRLTKIIGTTTLRVPALGGASEIKVGDCLFDRAHCVLPPTVHPKTGEPYRWIGTPLLEVDFLQLPLIETSK